MGTVVGPWAKDLSNSGEQVTLLAVGGATILDLIYADSWFPGTDGPGFTLVIYDPLAAPTAFSTVANWRQSAVLGGSPGANEPNLAPLVNAGADLSGFVTGVSISGSVSDDRLPDPPKALTFTWSQISGPGATTLLPPAAASATASFSQPGVYTLRLTVSDSSLAVADDVVVTAKDTPEAWLARYPDIGGFEDDFDGDGRSNLLELALGTDPTLGDTAFAEKTTMENGHLTITYTRIKPPSAVLYAIEVADQLASFRSPNVGEITEQILTDNGVIQTVKAIDSASSSAQSNRYLRLRISLAQARTLPPSLSETKADRRQLAKEKSNRAQEDSNLRPTD